MSRSGTYRFIAPLLAAFASAGMFGAQMSFAAESAAKAGKVEAVATQPAGKVTLSREVSASVKQLSQDLTKQLMSPRPGQEPLVHALPNAQQMQQSLEAYLRAIAGRLLGGDGNGESDNGGCFPGNPTARCRADEVLFGEFPQCWGNTKSTCSGAGRFYCQNTTTLKKRPGDIECQWKKMP